MNSKKTTVTLEDLLRVKRAERPPVEFWSEFEREMRAKQLAAIVGPRPWWAPLIRIGSRLAHYQVPAGAAAILALSFITLNHYRTTEVPSSDGSAAAMAIEPAVATELIVAAARPQLATPAPSHAQLDENYSSEELTAVEVASTGRAAHRVPLLEELAEPEPSPSARAIAANLAAAQAADPHILNEVFGSGVANVTMAERPRDPLARVSSPSESRRSRLLASALPVAAGYSEMEMGSSDRVVRRLTEDRLYDTISRIGVRGDRVAIKF